MEKFAMDMVYSFKGSLCHYVVLEKDVQSGSITVVTNYGEVVAVCTGGNQAAEVLKDLSDEKYAQL